jgi:excisionase family DNA binding protein
LRLTATGGVALRSVSIDRAAELAQVSRRTIYNRIRDGRLQTVRVGRSQRVTIESLSRLPEWVVARHFDPVVLQERAN